MKRHAIIPIFISHRGCPNQCVFCNQKLITTRSGDVTVDDARKTVDEWLTTLDPAETEIEISYFGGSFTGIPMEDQTAFLKLAKEYKDAGLVSRIHCSTRPDYITPEILGNLKAYGMDTIELGVQSFDDEVLRLCRRGHTKEDVYKACRLIREYGFTLGIQLMIGLPGDSYESCIMSAKETVAIAPEIARLYPTVVLPDTELAAMQRRGEYTAPEQDELLKTVTDMFKLLDGAGINVIRIGLKSNDLIRGETYHPAFGQLVKSRIAREKLAEMIKDIDPETEELDILAPSGMLNFAVGHKAENKEYLQERFPKAKIRFITDDEQTDICVRTR